jgi:hypothetical protein
VNSPHSAAVLAERATKYPIAIVKESRRQIAEALMTRREIVTSFTPGDNTALRFLRFVGFSLDFPMALPNGVGIERFSLRVLQKAA